MAGAVLVMLVTATQGAAHHAITGQFDTSKTVMLRGTSRRSTGLTQVHDNPR